MITDDPDLMARAVIMSGAYEHNWKKHPVLQDSFARWQNRLPLYNQRLNTLSAAVIRPQLDALPRRVADGRRNHDHVAKQLNQSPWIEVPDKLPPEERAPDSIQFNLCKMDADRTLQFVDAATTAGLTVQVFGQSRDNARAFWNWQFLGVVPELPKTRAMLMRACDVRLPARLSLADCDVIAKVILKAAETVMRPNHALQQV
jgi:dTDP-4-amino-4,6-dideoxygalactose transaminase